MGVRTSPNDVEVAGQVSLSGLPQKTDKVVIWDETANDGNGGNRGGTIEQVHAVVNDATVTNRASVGGTDRFAVVAPDNTLYHVTGAQLAALGGTTSPGPLNHTGWLSATQYVARPLTVARDLTTIYLNPVESGAIMLYNGSSWTSYAFTAPISLSLAGVAVGIYEVYVYDNAGTLTLELSTVWTDSLRTRSQAVTKQDGVYVKSGNTSRRLVGQLYVHATGKVNQGTTTPGIIPVQDMWDADEPHAWANHHAGNALPYHVCQILGPNFRNEPVGEVELDICTWTSAGSYSPLGFEFTNPKRMWGTDVGSAVYLSSPETWLDDWHGVSGNYDIAFSWTNIAVQGTPRVAHDTANNVLWYPSTYLGKFFKYSLSGAGSQTEGHASSYLHCPVYVPTQARLWGHHQGSAGQLMNEYNPATNTFGTGLAGTGFVYAGYHSNEFSCWCPINDRVYAMESTAFTIKVINPTAGSGSVVATISLTNSATTQSQFGGIFYVPTLRKVVCVYCRATTRRVKIAVIDPASNTIDFTVESTLEAKAGDVLYPITGLYVPGWDVILLTCYSNLKSYYVKAIIDCRFLSQPDTGMSGGLKILGRESYRKQVDAGNSVVNAYNTYPNHAWWPGDNTVKCIVSSEGNRRAQYSRRKG